MKKLLLFLTLTLVVSSAPAAQVIACFNENVQDRFFSEGDLSEEGAAKITILRSLDAWMAQMAFLGPKNFAGLTEEQSYQEIWARLRVYTHEFYNSMNCLENRIHFSSAVASGALPLLEDSALPFEVPKNCQILQTLTTQGEFFIYNQKIVSRLAKTSAPMELAILRAHEEMLQAAMANYGHVDAARTRNLMISLLNTWSAEESGPPDTRIRTPGLIAATTNTFGPSKRPTCSLQKETP